MPRKKTVLILLITVIDKNADAIQRAFSRYKMVFLKSKPSYANYLKILQYAPDAIVMELPRPFHDQLHFIQLVKQNRSAGAIPVICFGDRMPAETVAGMKKIGVASYLSRPFDRTTLTEAIATQFKKLGIALIRKSGRKKAEKKFDIEQILARATPSTRKTDLMEKHVSETIPFTVSMALKMLNSEKPGAGEQLLKIQSIYHVLQRFKEQCPVNEVTSSDIARAESLLEKVRMMENDNDSEQSIALISLAAEYYRRACLAFEMSRCEKSIAERENGIIPF